MGRPSLYQIWVIDITRFVASSWVKPTEKARKWLDSVIKSNEGRLQWETDTTEARKIKSIEQEASQWVANASRNENIANCTNNETKKWIITAHFRAFSSLIRRYYEEESSLICQQSNFTKFVA